MAATQESAAIRSVFFGNNEDLMAPRPWSLADQVSGEAMFLICRGPGRKADYSTFRVHSSASCIWKANRVPVGLGETILDLSEWDTTRFFEISAQRYKGQEWSGAKQYWPHTTYCGAPPIF